MLLQYGRWYKSIYEMPVDRPSESVIEDDVKLDSWFLNYQRRLARNLGGKGPQGGQDEIRPPDYDPTQ